MKCQVSILWLALLVGVLAGPGCYGQEYDYCPNDPDKVKAGQCGCGVADTDSDGDELADCLDRCPTDPDKQDSGLCGCGVADTDSDSDGSPDCNDGCPADPEKVEPGQCGCSELETDSDADGSPDCVDGCPADPEKSDPAYCGCSELETDSDLDSVPDCVDDCPADPEKADPGQCGCGQADTDLDQDGTADCVDGCPLDRDKVEPGVCDCGTADSDSDNDQTPDCIDLCPTDPDKIEPGVCGCLLSDNDSDSDGVPDCQDVCAGFDDDDDSDGDGIPDGCDPDAGYCTADPDCDDGLDCTENVCVSEVCITSGLSQCDWPAETSQQATNLTDIEGPLINNFHSDLSGAVWNPVARLLWVVRNGGPSKIWAVTETDTGSFEIDYQDFLRGEWTDFADLEGITQADFYETHTVYLIIEGQERIKEYDLSVYETAVLVNDWDTSAYLPAACGSGAEGITFVPDSFLAAQGFVDNDGNPYTSVNGMGGLMLVGHQNGGKIYAFDLDRDQQTFVFVGEYLTDATETAGLEFDRSTGLLYIWHGGGFNTLEVTRLSSQPVGNDRVLTSVKVYGGPEPVPFGSENYEGVAVIGADECDNDQRGIFLTIDGGGFYSLLWYRDFPCQ
ncbi:MAG: hypothetical protein JRJ87_10625 [Deltaproteobacteria bacterium]|nr:hypothetical protein [Deltaproteobacteria bacterium]